MKATHPKKTYKFRLAVLMLAQNYTFVLYKDKSIERSLKRHVLKTLFYNNLVREKKQNRTPTKKQSKV